MRYISGIENNKVRYIYLYLHTIAMMVIYHSDLYVLKDQIYILVNIQCNESRDIINLTIIIRSGPAVTWLRHTVMSPDTVWSVLQHSATPPVCAGVRYIWSPAHTGGWRGCCGVSRDTPEHVTRHVMWHSFGLPWLQTSRSQCWTTTGKKQNMEVESASNVNCDPSAKSPLKLYFWSKEGVMH